MPIRATDNPLDLFKNWLDDAKNSDLAEPTAVALATADTQGRPSARMVLLKGADDRGFVFYTNLDSRKGGELRANPHAALCFHWQPLGRQVRVEGAVHQVSDEEADDYFASRQKDSQFGAWASKQSRPLESRFALEKQVAKFALKFNVGTVPRPDHWSGFRLVPVRIEFWQHGVARLHDRLVYERLEKAWRTTTLYP